MGQQKFAVLCFSITVLCWLQIGGSAGQRASTPSPPPQPPSAKNGLTYCTETTPLDTKYFIPFYESHVAVAGCASQQKSTLPADAAFHVHVVRINSTSKEVMLHYNENDSASKGVIILLDSVYAVRWRLSFLGHLSKDYNIIVYSSAESTVISTNVDLRTHKKLNEVLQVTPSTSNEDFMTIVHRSFGGLSTFSVAQGANRISISLPKAESLAPTCTFVSNHNSNNSNNNEEDEATLGSSVLAYHVTKQSMSGCYHAEVAGASITDVHVIDLTTADPEIAGSVIPDDPSQYPAVYLSIFSDDKTEADQAEQRNLTLYLKSLFPVRWYLESWGLSGQLKAISNNGPIENYSLSTLQELNIVRRTLPTTFDQLMRTVTHETGVAPVSYIKVELANTLSLVIPPRSSKGFSDLLNPGGDAQLVPDATNLFDNESAAKKLDSEHPQLHHDGNVLLPTKTVKDQSLKERMRSVETTLQSYLVKKCTPSQMILVTLPLTVTDVFQVDTVRFTEPSCLAQKNQTHWILKTQSTSCGSISYFSDSNPLVRNDVVIKFAAGSELAGRTMRVPIICRFQAGLYNLGASSDDDYDNEDDDPPLERITDDDEDHETGRHHSDHFLEEEDDDEMYQIRVIRTQPSPAALLIENRGETATISVGDKIKIETFFDTRTFLNIGMEECWLSDGSDLRNQALLAEERINSDDPTWLIWQGCPSNKNVSLLSRHTTGFPAFSFRVTEAHARMGKVYLVCLIGLCTPNEQKMQAGDIVVCHEPNDCIDKTHHKSPSAQQITKRGPIFVIDKRDELEKSFVQSHNERQRHYSEPTETLGSPDGWYQQNQHQQEQRQRTSGNNNNNHVDDDDDDTQPRVVVPSSESPSLHSAHVVMVGVSAEIAVVIALASFIIGAVLTGLLCCVHHRRTLPKHHYQVPAAQVQRNGGRHPVDVLDGNELQSMMTSSPSSLLQQTQPNTVLTT